MTEHAIIAIFDIASFGAIMVLVVLGLGVTASMMGIFNFAHGELILLGACTAYVVQQANLSPWLGIVLAPVAVAFVGWGLERLIIRRFYTFPISAMLATFALSLIIRETVRYAIGGRYISVAEPVAGAFRIGSLNLPAWPSVLVVTAVAVVIGSLALLNLTRFGLLVRGALENPALLRASGVSTERLYSAAFTFAAALAGLAGALIAPVFSLFADLGVRFLIEGFIAVLAGGAGTLAGPLVGAFGVGILGSGLPWFVPPVLSDVLVFVIALVFVRIRPGGIISSKRSYV